MPLLHAQKHVRMDLGHSFYVLECVCVFLQARMALGPFFICLRERVCDFVCVFVCKLEWP